MLDSDWESFEAAAARVRVLEYTYSPNLSRASATSTYPRIRGIMTIDGGPERLISMLWDFCLSVRPLGDYDLTPSGYRLQKLAPTLNPTND